MEEIFRIADRVAILRDGGLVATEPAAGLSAERAVSLMVGRPLRDMYPEEDLGPAEDRLRLFLEQYWGGPKTYQEQRGHPRLRMRHAAYAVTPTQRDRWLHHMLAAVDTLTLPAAEDAELRGYLERAAQFMVNADD